MPKKYILALDQGTTSSRAIIFDRHGVVLSQVNQEFEQIYPQPGWVEHDPLEIWSTQLSVAHKALQKALLKPEHIAAIGITNQRETIVLWEKSTGKPLHNAIVWQCRRSADICRQLKQEGKEPLFQQKTGLLLDAYFSGTKLKWLLDRHPEWRVQAMKGNVLAGTIDSWLVYNLTGGQVHCTEPSNASRTLLYNIHDGSWDEELCQALHIPIEMLPEIRCSSEVYGLTASHLFEGHEIPIAGMAGDQQAALFGQGCFEPGMVKNTYGTGSFLLMNTGNEIRTSSSGLLTSVGWKLPNEELTYILEGSIFITGAVIQWLRDELQIIDSSEDSEKLAKELADNEGVYMVPAFVGLGAPYWDMNARGTITGMTRGTNRRHFVRAALESIAYQVRDITQAMEKDTGIPLKQLRVDGGATSNNFLLQFQADILGIPVERPVMTETTALGAAYLAGLATDYWSSQSDILENWQLDRRFSPNMEHHVAEKYYRGWQAAVKRTQS